MEANALISLLLIAILIIVLVLSLRWLRRSGDGSRLSDFVGRDSQITLDEIAKRNSAEKQANGDKGYEPPTAPPPSAPPAPGAPPPPQSIPAPKPVAAEPLPQVEIEEAGDDDEADEVLMDDLRGGAAMPEEAEAGESTTGKRREREEYIPHPAPAAPIIDSEAFGGSLPAVPIPQMLEAAQQVEFSAYYPKEVVPEKWEKLHAYIFRRLAAGAVEEDANKQLGDRRSEFRAVGAAAIMDVPEGAMITATPQMDGFQFNPPSVSLGFYKDWHRFDFEVRAKGAPLNQSTNGAITFTVEGIIVADIPLSIYVGDTVSSSDVRTSAQAKLYHAIFCSYSHRDTQIVTRAERAYKALGLDYLRDVISLKSGQEWDDELLNLISRADIFQLFWSSAAAQSPYVRQEWEYALKLGRDKFIRPVYWEDPKPSIPSELSHIHFAYQPDLDD